MLAKNESGMQADYASYGTGNETLHGLGLLEVCMGGQVGACRQFQSGTSKRSPQRKMQCHCLFVAPMWVCHEASGDQQQQRRGRASWNFLVLPSLSITLSDHTDFQEVSEEY